MRASTSVAVVATFSALVIGSDFALAPFSNVKLLDTMVFVSAYVFGFRVGALVGVISETAWSVVSPIGVAGAVAPFLIGGEVLFAVAGWGAARLWKGRHEVLSFQSVFIGSLLLICAFLWDLETNFATALLGFWPAPSLVEFLSTAFGPLTIPFIVAHELSDFAFGVVLAPVFIVLISRMKMNHP